VLTLCTGALWGPFLFLKHLAEFDLACIGKPPAFKST